MPTRVVVLIPDISTLVYAISGKIHFTKSLINGIFDYLFNRVQDSVEDPHCTGIDITHPVGTFCGLISLSSLLVPFFFVSRVLG